MANIVGLKPMFGTVISALLVKGGNSKDDFPFSSSNEESALTFAGERKYFKLWLKSLLLVSTHFL